MSGNSADGNGQIEEITETEVTLEVVREPMVHQVTKMLLGAIACFVVSKLVNNTYDTIVDKVHGSDEDETNESTEV